MQRPRIEAVVAQILTERELALNKGKQDGVEIGMRFVVLNRRGRDILDPVTGQSLGSVELEKAIVKVVRVYDKLAIARTFRTYENQRKFLLPAEFLGLSDVRRERVETFRTDERKLRDELSEEESFVKIGDPALQIVGDEFDTSTTVN